jgi:hypothetical protein
MTSQFLKNGRALGVESARIDRANKRDLYERSETAEGTT